MIENMIFYVYHSGNAEVVQMTNNFRTCFRASWHSKQRGSNLVPI